MSPVCAFRCHAMGGYPGNREHPPPRCLGSAPNGHQPRLPVPRQSRRAEIVPKLDEPRGPQLGPPNVQIEEAAEAAAAQTLLVVALRVGREQDAARFQRATKLRQHPRQSPARHVEQRRVREHAGEAAFGKVYRQKFLMEDLASRSGASHSSEFLRSVEAHCVVAQGPEEVQVPPGPAAQIENGKGGGRPRWHPTAPP